MNFTTDQPPPPPPQQPPLQPHRSSFSCDRHPTEQFTGFCPSCLCERLTSLDQSSASSSRRPSNASTAASALKAIFRVPISTTTTDNNNNCIKGKSKPSSSTSFFPELRRTKSFSASKNEGFSGVFEPQRRSCDVRARSTLWSLFTIDDECKSTNKNDQSVEVETRNVTGPMLESKEEEDEHGDPVEEVEEEDDDGDEIRVSEEIVEEEIVEEQREEEIKTMKLSYCSSATVSVY